MKRTILSALVCATVLALGSSARGEVPAKIATEIRRDIARARTIDPDAFVAVREAAAKASAIDAKARGRKAPIALYLQGLGNKALLPMLEMIAFESTSPSLRRDLVEAVGLLRDARALPVLGAMLDDETDAATVRAVTEAVARLGTDDASARLGGALERAENDKNAAKTAAILSAIGECRRASVATALASRARTGDDAAARVIARSLGRVGNAWAWKTMTDRREEAVVRETAARALVDLYVHRTGEARDVASNAIMVVDDPHTPALIAEARRGASADVATALDALAARFARNPSR